MIRLLRAPLFVLGGVLTAGLLSVASAAIARPGTVNYAEGSVTLNGQTVAAKALGSTEVEPGQVLQTEQGKAEMLLTPSVSLRLGDQSSVRMVSSSLIDTRVEVEKGIAIVEVDQIANENRLDVIDGGVTTTLEKKGIYRFNGDQPLVAVYD